MWFSSPVLLITHHAEVSDGNPVHYQLDKVVVHGIDDYRDLIGQCISKLEVKLLLAQQINARIFRCLVWDQVKSKQ